jgi:ATP-binding cassette subfamily B protein
VEPAAPFAGPRPLQRGIVFDRVTFAYPSGAGTALQDISLTIEPGKLIALVGQNGSGKTTLIKLLCRLYDPSQGTIAVDGTDLRQFATLAWRRQISVIFQDYLHYSLTARQNIWLGDVRRPEHDPRLMTAARQTGADQVIRKLPRGYETVLGHWFEEEGELSVGEWQKVALARTFFREAQLLILDEPTSWMDAEAEFAVFQSFRELARGRTAILISHRFANVRQADYIYVLDQGRISEQVLQPPGPILCPRLRFGFSGLRVQVTFSQQGRAAPAYKRMPIKKTGQGQFAPPKSQEKVTSQGDLC